MKTFNTDSMVSEATAEIEKIAPKNSFIDIDVVEDPVGHYSTQIKLSTNSKTYFAKKDDLFLYKSFSKALRALKMQLTKKRTSHIHDQVGLKRTRFSMP